MKAMVIFCDVDEGLRSKFLKRGFKHVFCLLQGPTSWTIIDGRRGIPAIQAYCPADFDVALHFRAEGMTVRTIDVGNEPSAWPLSLNNCVGMVKVACCIRSFAVTPYQLFKHLEGSPMPNPFQKFMRALRLPGFGGPSVPAPPPPPPPPAPTPKKADKAVQAARTSEQKRARLQTGIGGTVLTGSQGLAQPANVTQKKLLGQ